MSTITVSNIKKTGETASRDVSGVAAAWINFNGTGTIAARDSENVSSLTDNGTGNYIVNFNNAFDAANYACLGVAGRGGSTNTLGIVSPSAAPTTTTFNILPYDASFSLVDSPQVNISAHGDLA